MKKLLILTLLTLWAFIDIKAQSNYFITSVADVEITETGSGFLSGQSRKDTSEVATSQRFWFLSPKGFDNGSQQWIQAGLLNVALKNLSSTQWKKVTLYDFTGTNLLYTQNIAPNATIYFDFSNNRRLDASKDYYWKFENVNLESAVCNNDSKAIESLNFGYIDVLANDLNLPSGTDCRLKAGQTLAGGLVVTKDQFTGLKVTTSSQQGSFSFIYEAVNNGTVLGEATATIIVGASSQFCTLVILDERLQTGSQTIHEFTLYSPNAQINPFNYEVRTGSYTGTIVKSGTTPPATSTKETIDFTGLATGTYYVTFSSSVSNCTDYRVVSHVATDDACNTSIISVDKLNGTNNYSVNSSFSNVTSIKAYLTNAQISVGSPLLSQTGITTPAFTLNLTSLPTGTYFLNIEGEGKFCKAQKSFEHTLVVATSTGKLETWTKFIHNYKDNIIVSGKNDYESGRDKFGLQSYAESATNVTWKAFISDFENLGNSNRAKALIGFRKDTARNEIGVSVAITPTSLILQQRSTKSGAMVTLATVSGITAPVWIRLTKTGNNLVADYSKDLTMTPVYTELGRVNNVFNSFNRYQKYLGVSSAKTDVIASARFQGFLGGNVNFDSPNVTIDPPLIASNVLSPSSGQSVTLSTSTACIAPNTNKWYKNTDNISFSAGSTVNVQAYNTDSYYARCENGLNKSVKSNVVTFTISNLLSCNNGTNPFAVASAVYASGNVTFIFNANGLTNANWSVLNGATITKTGTIQPTASTQTISVSSLTAGNYIFKLDGISCNGTSQKSFTVAGSVSAPVIASLPASPVAGDNITLSATGCVGNYNWYVSGSSTPYSSNTGSSTVNAVLSGSYYYATCVGSTVASNYISVGSIGSDGSGGNTGQASFVNVIKSVPIETTLGKYNPDAFPTISVVNSLDTKLGRTYPNWAIGWKVEGGNFTASSRNKKTQNVGIPFMYDIVSNAYKGYGINGVDFVFAQNVNNGCPWGQTRDGSNNCVGTITDIDPSLSSSIYNNAFGNLPHTHQNFISAIPFELRAGGNYGIAGDGERNRWLNATIESGLHFDDGQKGGSGWFGQRDWVNGKSNVGLSDSDIEIGIETGEDGSNKHLAFLLGGGMKVQGYFFSQYSAPLNTVYIDPSKYPSDYNNPNSSFPQYAQLIDGTNGQTNSGNSGLSLNSIPNSNDWNPSNKISIPNRFSGQKGILDVPNVIPCIEIASYASATFKHGEEFYYDQDNPSLKRTINKFGLNANADHIIARVIFAGETNKWYTDNKLDGRKVILQSKITCDAGTFGTLNFDNGGANKYHNKVSLRFAHFGREYGFDIGGFTAFTGCEWNIWDRNDQEHNLDGYHGAFGLINLLYQRKTFGNTSVSFVDLKPRAKFLLWESQISYDNGDTYIKDKANNYVMSQTKIPQRQFITPDGYWGGFLARPENTEATSCILRVSYNGQNYTHTVSANDWETVDYNFRNTALASLPNDKKDYYYFLVKLTNGATSENNTINAPSITKNVLTPTEGQSVILTSSGCQSSEYTTKWYDSSEGNLLATSLTYTVTAQNGKGYYAKCVGTSGSSANSNIITFSTTTTGVTITEPAKGLYFFSNNQAPSFYANRSNLPAVITNTSTFDATNDIVYLENSQVKYGINLKRGGQLCYASLAGSTDNLIFNGYDGGFQVQLDATQILEPATIQGQTSGSPENNNAYNTTMGGDYLNKATTLIDYKVLSSNSYYVKFRPILYPFNAVISEVEIEVTYTLIGRALKIEYNYTSFRTDGNFPLNPVAPQGYKGWAIPVCFLVEKLNRYQTYTGNSPWTNQTPEDGAIPNTTPNQNGGSILGRNTKEFWGLSYSQSDNVGFGAMNLSEGGTERSFRWEQREKVAGNPQGGVFGNGGRTVMDMFTNVLVPNGGNFTKSITSFVAVGQPSQIISTFYQQAGY